MASWVATAGAGSEVRGAAEGRWHRPARPVSHQPRGARLCLPVRHASVNYEEMRFKRQPVQFLLSPAQTAQHGKDPHVQGGLYVATSTRMAF